MLCCSASLFLPPHPFPLLLSFCCRPLCLCRPCADILLWKGNDPTVLRLCMCAAHCNGPAFYCLLHTNPTTEGMRWHLQGAVCELQPHMKEWPLKMIKEITILSCTTLLSCLARCTCLCPGVRVDRHARPHTHPSVHELALISFSLWWIFSKWSSVEMSCAYLPQASADDAPTLADRKWRTCATSKWCLFLISRPQIIHGRFNTSVFQEVWFFLGLLFN